MLIKQENCEIDIRTIDIGKETAIEIAKTEFWKETPIKELVNFQFFNTRLLMPFDFFHEAVERVLGRPVWTHEFASNKLRDEVEEKIPRQSFEDILNQLQKDKTIIIIAPRQQTRHDRRFYANTFNNTKNNV